MDYRNYVFLMDNIMTGTQTENKKNKQGVDITQYKEKIEEQFNKYITSIPNLTYKGRVVAGIRFYENELNQIKEKLWKNLTEESLGEKLDFLREKFVNIQANDIGMGLHELWKSEEKLKGVKTRIKVFDEETKEWRNEEDLTEVQKKRLKTAKRIDLLHISFDELPEDFPALHEWVVMFKNLQRIKMVNFQLSQYINDTQ